MASCTKLENLEKLDDVIVRGTTNTNSTKSTDKDIIDDADVDKDITDPDKEEDRNKEDSPRLNAK